MRDYINKIIYANRDMPQRTKIIYIIIGIIIIGYIGQKILLEPKYLLAILALYTGIIFHELGHGYAAKFLGDDTAKKAGRLTLNPIKHFDPLGVIVPLILIFIGSPIVFGWAKPVPVNFAKVKKENVGLFIIGIAGVFINFINCIIAALLLRFFPVHFIPQAFGVLFGKSNFSFGNIQMLIVVFLMYVIVINLALALFNLIPIPPFDGSRILASFLSYKAKVKYFAIEKYGFIIIILLLLFGVINVVFDPIFSGLFMLLLKVFGGY